MSGPPPLKNHKNIWFSSNTGPDPLKNRSHQARIQCWTIIGTPAKRHLMAFCRRADHGPLIVALGSSLPSSTKKTKQKKNTSKFGPLSDKTFWILTCGLEDKQADDIDAFNTTSRYLDDILNINNIYFDNMVELQLNKANTSDTEAAFLDLHLSISNDIVSTKTYDKRDDFDFEIVNFPFLDGDVPRSTSYGVYISQLIRFARTSSIFADFNTRNKLLTQKLLKQGYRYHKLRKTFSKFYRRYYDLISKFQVGLKSLLRQGLSEPDFYGDLVYKLKKIVGSNNFSAQFIKIFSHYKKIGYNINVLQQTACLVVNPITVGNFAFLFDCRPMGRT